MSFTIAFLDCKLRLKNYASSGNHSRSQFVLQTPLLYIGFKKICWFKMKNFQKCPAKTEYGQRPGGTLKSSRHVKEILPGGQQIQPNIMATFIPLSLRRNIVKWLWKKYGVKSYRTTVIAVVVLESNWVTTCNQLRRPGCWRNTKILQRRLLERIYWNDWSNSTRFYNLQTSKSALKFISYFIRSRANKAL